MTWIGYELTWIRQRHAALSNASHLDGLVTAPGLLWLFGEQGFREIDVVFATKNTPPNAVRAETKRIADLFPEAEFVSVYGNHETW
jgi:hypothetical protein